MISDHVDYLVRSIESSALAVIEELQELPSTSHLDEQLLHKLLQKIAMTDPVIQIGLIGRAGWSVALRDQYPSKPVDLSDRKHASIFFQEGRRKLYISEPVLGRVSKQWTLQFALPVFSKTEPEAAPVFILVISASSSSLTSFLKEVAEFQGVMPSVIGTDGIVRAQGGNSQYVGRNLSQTPMFLSMMQIGVGPFDLHRSGVLDSSRRVGYVRTLPVHELMIVASVSEKEIQHRLVVSSNAMVIGWLLLVATLALSLLVVSLASRPNSIT